MNKWEGMLFPDTYEFSDDAKPDAILQKMADQMTTELDELGFQNSEAKVGLSPYDTVIVASLVVSTTKVAAARGAAQSAAIVSSIRVIVVLADRADNQETRLGAKARHGCECVGTDSAPNAARDICSGRGSS